MSFIFQTNGRPAFTFDDNHNSHTDFDAVNFLTLPQNLKTLKQIYRPNLASSIQTKKINQYCLLVI